MDQRSEFAADGGPSRRQTRLAQLYRRDPRAEGRFWYSVITTGVYCRPTCPARQARPENIRLHDSLAEARATGFRPCARCRPEAPSLADRQRRLIADACLSIERADAPPDVKALARAAGMSPSHFYRLFRKLTDSTPGAWARRRGPNAASVSSPDYTVPFRDRRL